MQIFPSPRVVARQIVAWPSCPWHFAVKTAENSEKQRTFSLLFRRSNWQKPRISDLSEMSIAVNFWPKQRKTAMGLVRHSRNIVYQAILPTVMEMAKEELMPVDSLQKQVGSGVRSGCTIPPCGRSKLFATRSDGSGIEPLMHI